MDDHTEIFMRTEASSIDDAFTVPSVFDQQRAVFRKPEPVEALQRSLKHYQALGLQPRLRFEIKDCTWDDILDLIATSRRNYEQKAEGLKGLFRKAFRKAGDNSVRIAPLFEMIPGDDGLSVLKGGLGWILTLARESAKKRDKIFSAFETIPEAFIMAMEKRKIFSESRQLQEKVASLHAMLVDTIMQLAAFLLREHRVKAKFPFISTTPSVNDVSCILDKVDFQCQSLIRYVDNLTEAAVVDTHRMVSGIPNSFEMQRLLEDVKHGQRSAIEQSMASLSEQFSIDAQTAVRPLLLELVSSIQRGYEILELQANIQHLRSLELHWSLTPSYSTTEGVMNIDHLFTALDVNPSDATHDLTTILRAGQHFDDKEKLRASEAIEDERFKKLCYSTHPGILLIEGGIMHNMSNSRASPLSAICASVVAGMPQQPERDIITLFFFCGLHTATHDNLRGPKGIMRAMISRVLIELAGRRLANLGFIETRSYRQDLEAHEITALCHTFKNLVRQFPLDTIICCIIDGVGWCEQDEWAQDIDLVMDTLYGLVHDQRLRPIFKVLITSSMRCRYFSRALPLKDRMFTGANPATVGRDFSIERFSLLNRKKAEYFEPDGNTSYISENAKGDDFYT